MKTFFYILAVIGAIASTLLLFSTIATSNSAPQEGAGAAIAACIAIIPYVFARSVDKGTDPNAIKELLQKQIAQNNEIIILLKKGEGIGLTDEEKARLYK